MPVKRDLAERFWEKVDKSGDCWLWTAGKDNNGYGQINIKRRPIKAHRVAYMLTYDADITGVHLCHHCDNPACVNPEHLFVGTQADNVADMVKKDRQRKGEAVPNGKLHEGDVHVIRDLVASGIKQKDVADFLGVSRNIVNRVVLRRHWKHI